MKSLKHIALLIRMDRAFDRDIAQGVGSYLRDNPHWSVFVGESASDASSEIADWHADGIIGDINASWPRRIADRTGVPLVGFGVPTPTGDFGGRPVVMAHHHQIGAIAANHLLEKGIKHLAYCGLDTLPEFHYSLLRWQGFRDTTEAAGGTFHRYKPDPNVAGNWGAEQARLRSWLVTLPKPAGVLALYDGRALKVIDAARVEGIRIPEDIAVLGIDNDVSYCRVSDPTLSSIEPGSHRIGYQAATVLDGLLSGVVPKQNMMLIPPERVVERNSTNTTGFEDEQVAEGIRFIRIHACDPITVDQVLDHIGASVSTGHRKFKQHLGRSIHAEIRRVQMERVRRLLIVTNHPIKQIAYEAGFENTKYLARAFREAHGTTPSEFRRTNQMRS
ncbi:XylR family transcriptional regulator [Mucisphaera sp.]|uniref:XylR family transcriptional regulator n=1 Tax=Mucisphaera sp. TaxID=2913024 RepID=UPI003D120256